MRAFAPAKVNLYLHVVGRRPDGYHLLDSLAVFPDIGDTVRAVPAEHLSLAVDGPFGASLAGEPDNLVLRAAQRLAERVGRLPAVALSLTKNLPVASGIGGGSSDAAAALRALATLWDVPPDAPVLLETARDLGADVPVCVAARPSFMGGIGDELAPPPDLPPGGMLLVNPGVAVPTPSVFRARQGDFSTSGRFTEALPDMRALASVLRERRNDLTDGARSVAPVVGDVLAALDGTAGCLLARMSGSGATCFGLYEDAAQARDAAAAIRAARPVWWAAAGTVGGTG